MNLIEEWYFIDNDTNPIELARKPQTKTHKYSKIFTNLARKYEK